MARVLTPEQYVELSAMDVPEPPDVAKVLTPARLHISRDNWIAECPEGCGYAIVACPGLAMVCPTHGWFDVVWPLTLKSIEKVLDKRPDVRTRNWLPHETVKALLRENRDHGVD